MSNMFKPKISNKTPAPAPQAKKLEAPKRELGDEGERKKNLRRKKGRNALRIDPQTGGVGRTGTGINVPMK